MWARCLQPVVACTVLAAVVLFGVACGDGEQGVAANTRLPGQTEGDEGSTSTPRPSTTWTTASTAPGSTAPQPPCGVVTAPGGTDVRVAVVEGNVTCADAEALLGFYYDDIPDPSEEPDQLLVLDGWECVTDQEVEPGPVTTCTLPGVGVVGAAPDPG